MELTFWESVGGVWWKGKGWIKTINNKYNKKIIWYVRRSKLE